MEVKPADNTTYPALVNRTQDCELTKIGKPVFHNFLNLKYGAWLRDPIKKENVTVEKIWLTNDSDTMHLQEFNNRNDLRKGSRSKLLKLTKPFKVVRHIF